MDAETIFADIHDDCEEAKNESEVNCSCVQRCCFISDLYHKLRQGTTTHSEFGSFLNNEFIINKDYTIIQLLNDYHHLLSHHNTDLELIHSLSSNCCNINECYLISQNNENNENNENNLNNNSAAIFNILDSIHRYLYHTFDFGFTCTKKQQLSLVNAEHEIDIDDDIETDSYLLNLKQYLNINLLEKHKGNLDKNKYITSIDTNELKEDEQSDVYSPEKQKHKHKSKHNLHKRCSSTYNSQKYRTDKESLKVYSFGKKWRYDSCYKTDETKDTYNGGICKWWYIQCKYKDLKTEILQNMLHTLDINEWNCIIAKVTYLSECNKCKQMDSNMELNNILSIILYIDNKNLCEAFIETYRKLNSNETDKQWVERHCEFGNLGKILRDTVNTFGVYMHEGEEKENNINFYHNISCKMVFKSTMINFLGPTSLTTNINTGLIYSNYNNKNRNGLLLNIEPHYNIVNNIIQTTKIFECNWLCNFIASEMEYLTIGNTIPITTKTIIIPKTCHNYQYYLHGIKILNLFINNKHSNIEINRKIFKAISNLITNQCLKYSEAEAVIDNHNEIQRKLLFIPKYLDKLFVFFINSVRGPISISIEKLLYNKGKKKKKTVYGYGAIKDIFMNGNNIIDIDLLLTLFRKTKKIKVWCKDKLILNDELINSFLNFLALQNISKIQSIEIIKPLETEITIKQMINKYTNRFMKIKWKLTEKGKGVYPVLCIDKIKELKRTKSTFVRQKKKTKPYEIEHNLRPSLLPPKKRYNY